KVSVLYQRRDQNATRRTPFPRMPAAPDGWTFMDYVSTRGEAPTLGFADALLAGLARDGGLYVPREWPTFSAEDIRGLRGLSYADCAFRILKPFVEGQIDDTTLRRAITDAYATFRH